ncbi:unnamed protein product, partial [Tilletia controversa]
MLQRGNSLLLPLAVLLSFVLPSAVRSFELNITRGDICNKIITVSWNMSLTPYEYVNGYYWQNYIGSPSNPTEPGVNRISTDFSG